MYISGYTFCTVSTSMFYIPDFNNITCVVTLQGNYVADYLYFAAPLFPVCNYLTDPERGE